MANPCKHDFSSVTTPDPDGAKKKKLKFHFCGACGGFMAVGALTPSQRAAVLAAVEQLRSEGAAKRKK